MMNMGTGASVNREMRVVEFAITWRIESKFPPVKTSQPRMLVIRNASATGNPSARNPMIVPRSRIKAQYHSMARRLP
jgi:hypothetical protein